MYVAEHSQYLGKMGEKPLPPGALVEKEKVAHQFFPGNPFVQIENPLAYGSGHCPLDSATPHSKKTSRVIPRISREAEVHRRSVEVPFSRGLFAPY